MWRWGRGFAVLLVLLPRWVLLAQTFPLPPEDVDLVGRIQWVSAHEEETLLDIARQYDLGQEEIVLANPGVDRWLPGEGTNVLLPTRYILPKGERRGLLLNLPEMRLYYFSPPHNSQEPLLITHPVSVGRMDWETPLGVTKVVRKTKDPSWRPPQSLRAEAAAEGDPLPELVPPGPDNPLGRFALRLGLPGYLIHGTNKPFGVGMRVSHGCIRMYPEDIEPLFARVRLGTPVAIVNQPIKLGWLAETLFIEVHPPLEEESVADQGLLQRALESIYASIQGRPVILDGGAIRAAIHNKNGIPVPISKGPLSRPVATPEGY